MKRVLTDKEYQRMSNEYDKVKIRCKCGHRVVIPVWVDKQICHWCGMYVYRDKQLEFKETMKLLMKEV